MIFLLLIMLSLALALLGVTLWNALCWPRVTAAQQHAPAHSISILIPARDEELHIAACLDAALAQGSLVREVLVYDDHSTDRTAQIVVGYARRDARVRMLAPTDLPAGWCGKTFACAQLAAAAHGTWLLFLDADACLHTNAAPRMLADAETRAVSLLSCWPALELISFWERALMPLLNVVVFTLYPAPLALKRRDASLGLAHGSCLLARRDVYRQTGGHALVRHELFEDVRLAQAWRAGGETSLCLDGQEIVSVRMYRSFAEIWRGFQKNFFPAFRRERSFWLFIVLHLTVFLLPFIIAPFVYTHTRAWPLIVTACCVLAIRVALALRFKHPWWSVLLHPFCEGILIALGLTSWWRCKSGRGVEWKGRRYHNEAAGLVRDEL